MCVFESWPPCGRSPGSPCQFSLSHTDKVTIWTPHAGSSQKPEEHLFFFLILMFGKLSNSNPTLCLGSKYNQIHLLTTNMLPENFQTGKVRFSSRRQGKCLDVKRCQTPPLVPYCSCLDCSLFTVLQHHPAVPTDNIPRDGSANPSWSSLYVDLQPAQSAHPPAPPNLRQLFG